MTIRVGISIGIGSVILLACAGSHSSSSVSAPSLATQYTTSVSYMQQMETGMSLYLGDYDGVFPTAGKWMDETTIYVNDPKAYKSPVVAGRGYGYALNSAVAGQSASQISSPDTTVLLFDSTDLTRNATDSTSTLPNPPRYGSKNTTGYVDGRVQDGILTQSISQLQATSLTRMKQNSLSTLLYANDYDDAFPLPNQWMDGETPYSKNPQNFQSPLVEVESPVYYGYSMNTVTAGQNESSFTSPATLYSIFDSTDLLRNATDPTSTLPSPGRYLGVNTIGYADGHANFAPNAVAKLKR